MKNRAEALRRQLYTETPPPILIDVMKNLIYPYHIDDKV